MSLLEPGTLEAFGLYLVRTSALVISSPLLGTGAGFGGYRIGLIVATSGLLYSVSGEPLAAAPLPIEYALFVLREVLIGVFLGFVLHAVMLAVRVAGELIGHEMTFNMAQIVDPTTGLNTPLITRMYEAFFFLGLLAVDGHHWLLRALADSFGRAPIGSMSFNTGAFELALRLFTELFTAGITFAAPVLVLLALTSLMIGLLSRAVPQINIMDAGFTLRIVVGLLALLVFVPFLAPALGALYGRFETGLQAALTALEG